MAKITLVFVTLTGDPPPTTRRPKRRFWLLLTVGVVLIAVCICRPELRPLVRALFKTLERAVFLARWAAALLDGYVQLA